MKPMTTIARLCWPALTMALTFVLAACSAGGGSAPDEARGGSSQRTPSATDTSRAGDSTRTSASNESTSSGESSSSSAMRGSSASAGDQVEIRQAWVQVRNSPNANSGAIALAFGNDTFDVVGEDGDWVRVRIARGREGWIPRSATEAR